MSAGGQVFGSEGKGMPAIGGKGSDNFQKSQAGMGAGGESTVNKPEPASDFKFRNRDLNQFAASELRLYGEAGNQGNAVAAGHESLNGFEAGELDTHIQWRLIASKGLDDPLTERRSHGVGDEILGAELADGNLLLFCKGVLRVHYEDDGVGVDGHGVETRIVWVEGEHAELHGMLDKLIGDLAGERALHGDADVGIVVTESVKHGQQPETGVFIGGDGEASALEGAQFFEGRDGFRAEAQKTLRVTAEKLTGGGGSAVARGAFEEGLADFVLQLANGMADGRLGAAHANGGTGEAFFFKDGEEGFELMEVHGVAPHQAAVPPE